MKKNNPKDKRLYPRIEQALPVKIAANGFDFVTTTQNVSCVGAYCRIDKYIPPFTKVMVKLNLPVASANQDTNSVECYGVVVRTEDEDSGGFNIAIFFNKIKENQRQRIAGYLNKFLTESSLEPSRQ